MYIGAVGERRVSLAVVAQVKNSASRYSRFSVKFRMSASVICIMQTQD